MKRRAAKVDDNQPLIVRAFRAGGASVAPTHAAGQGFPDLVVGYLGQNRLVEVKDGSKPASKRKLTSDQVEFHVAWRGSVDIVENTDQVFDLLAKIRDCAVSQAVHSGTRRRV